VGVVLLLGICNSFPQGQIFFNNRVNNVVVGPVYDVESTDPYLQLRGNTPAGTPAGTQTYTGRPLAGTGFTAQLFAGATNATKADLEGLTPQVNFRVSEAAGFIVAPSSSVTVPGFLEGERVQLEMRAWNNRAGTITNWDQVLDDATIERGESLPFLSEPLGGPFTPVPNLNGLRSFNLSLGQPLRLDIRMTNSVPQVIVYGSAGLHYEIEYRPTLDSQSTWQSVTNFILPNSPWTFDDVTANGEPIRFYRALQVP
jgi:hypothetical protein